MNRSYLTVVAAIICSVTCTPGYSQGLTTPLNGGSGATAASASSGPSTTTARPAAPAGAENAAGVTAAAPPSPVASAALSSDYRLDTDDTISIGVTRHSDVGGTYRISPDGMIRLPRLLKPIDVRGKTCDELTTEITSRLTTEGKLVLRPGQVTVVVVGTRVRRIFVRGNAVRGGDYDLQNGWHVDDVVAIMGALPQPDRLTARVTNAQRPAAIPISLDAALKNPASPDNVALQEGDTLTIDQPGVKRLMIKGEGPRGLHEVDERFGLRQALISLGFTTNGATGDLHAARIIRYATPGDASSAATYIPVDLITLLSNDAAADVPYKDMDTLEIPISDQYIYIAGEIAGPPRKWYLPQDRKTYLIDVFASATDVNNQAKVGSIQISRRQPDGKWDHKSYDLGKFIKDADPKDNPEILPHDMVYVPTNRHTDPISSIWTGWGLYSILKAVNPAL